MNESMYWGESQEERDAVYLMENDFDAARGAMIGMALGMMAWLVIGFAVVELVVKGVL